MRSVPLMLASVAAVAIALPGCGGTKRHAAAPTAAGPTTAPTGCQRVGTPPSLRPQRQPKPTRKLDPRATYTANVVTSCGSFAFTLAVKQAPKTAASFAALVKRHFYDGLILHRVVHGFVIQGGDPVGDGSGGPGYTIREQPPPGTRYTQGVVAMAKSGQEPAGTSGSQFFVVTGSDAGLPPDYALLGKVTKGLDVVERIDAVAVDPRTSRPLDAVVIVQIRVQRG